MTILMKWVNETFFLVSQSEKNDIIFFVGWIPGKMHQNKINLFMTDVPIIKTRVH